MGEWIHYNGDLFSLLSLLIALLTFAGVLWNKKILNRLDRKNLKTYRLPENLKDLKTISNNISDLLIDVNKNKKKIKLEFSKISPILKSLKKSLSHDELENVKLLKQSLKDIDYWNLTDEKLPWYKDLIFKNIVITDELVNEIDIKLSRLITDIENIRKDSSKTLLK